jgi:hypothetical protein
MGILNLEFTSTPCEGKYAKISISFNDEKIECDLSLSAEITKLSYNVNIFTESDNVINIDLLNSLANEYNPETQRWEEVRSAILTSANYSLDNKKFIRLFSFSEAVRYQQKNLMVTTELPMYRAQNRFIVIALDIKEFIIYNLGYKIKFNKKGIVDNDFIKNPINRVLNGKNFADAFNSTD